MQPADDQYARLSYRRFIAWPARLEREAPLLDELLDSAPAGDVLDLGCGPGEHARFLAERGRRVLGVDRSPAMLEAARERPLPDGVELVEGDLRDLAAVTDRRFAAALCLGNTLPHLQSDDDLAALAGGLAERLLPGGRLLTQSLNYERMAARGERHLPLAFRPDPDGEGELVFLRMMRLRDGGRIHFCPSTLRFDPRADPPLEVVTAKSVELRAWRAAELTAHLERAGFAVTDRLGGFDGRPFEARRSRDVVLLATRR